MKSKKIICGAVAAAVSMSVAFSGCGLISTINEEDMKQTVAVVNIGKSEELGDLQDFASLVGEEVIVKRDLIAAFINVGSTYVNSYGYTYEQTFNLLMDDLTSNAVVVQYATMYVLKEKVEEGLVVLSEYSAKTTEQAKYEYLLGGEDAEGVLKAKFNLYTSLNDALDSYEKNEIDDEDEYVGTATRTTPSNVDTAEDDYLPLDDDGNLDYGVYTGYYDYLLENSGVYRDDALDNTTRNTRRKAYSKFVSSLKNNYLLTEEDTDLSDVLGLSYVRDQYLAQLQQSVIEVFTDMYEEEQEQIISAVDGEGIYTFVQDQYNGQDGLLGEQEKTYSNVSTFESAMSSMSDTSFVLYSPDTTQDTEEQNGTYGTYGYVYNILLPYSVTQNSRLTLLQSYRDNGVIDENGYYAERNALLRGVTTTDQRSAWFNGATDYSFDASEAGIDYFSGGNADRTYLFFENNVTKAGQYKSLDKYVGLYSYNGKVTENNNGSYKLVPNVLTIDGMLVEFSAYINYVLGTTDRVEIHAGDTLAGGDSAADYEAYYAVTDFKDASDESKVDYSKMVYATGRVILNDTAKETMFVDTTDRYKVMAAVNELQYAYTTDTGVLSQYIGYSVSAYETSYIKEFEYAAQQAVRMGVGTFKVCAGDYGWHLIYVTDTFSFNGGEVYRPVFSKANVEKEGTFENKFYEWIKDKTLANEITLKRAEILQAFSNDVTVVTYEKAYQDLLGLDN